MSNVTSLRVADLPQNAPTSFDLRPAAAALDEIRQDLGLLGLRKLSFSGDVQARGKRDWVLNGKLGATVIQPCVVTLEPVTTRIDMCRSGAHVPCKLGRTFGRTGGRNARR